MTGPGWPPAPARGRDDACGGGLRWNTTSGYKNAITSELFLTLAALLHQRTPGEQGGYLTWAQHLPLTG